MSRQHVVYAFLLAALSSVFLSTGLVVNSLMIGTGISWAWLAALRFLLLLPWLLLVTLGRGRLRPLWRAFRQLPRSFLLWGSASAGGYYALLALAGCYLPGWLVGAAFMTTILTGLLLSPWLYTDQRAVIPRDALLLALLLLACLCLMEFGGRQRFCLDRRSGLGILLALVAAVLWPLGNRKLLLALEYRGLSLDPVQRSLGIVLGSLPVLLLLAAYGYCESGLLQGRQWLASAGAAFFAGLLGGALFYQALQLVQRRSRALAAVEALQVLCIVFTLLGEIWLKGLPWPGPLGLAGLAAMLLTLIYYLVRTFRQLH